MSRFENPSSLQLHFKQDLDYALFASELNSMPNLQPSPTYYASFRFRKLNARRLRPCAASIADLLVGSSLMAGLCREHLPGSRRLSTTPMAAATCRMTKWRSPNNAKLGHGHGHGIRQGRLRSRTENLGLRYMQTQQRLVSNEKSQTLDYHDDENYNSNISNGAEAEFRPSLSGNLEDDDASVSVEAEFRDAPDKSFLSSQLNETTNRSSKKEPDSYLGIDFSTEFDKSPTYDYSFPSKEDYESSTDPAQERKSLIEASSVSGFKVKMPSPTRAVYTSIGKLYRGTIGEKMEWRTARRSVARMNSLWPRLVSKDASNTNIMQDAYDIPGVRKLVKTLFDKKRRSNHYIFNLYRELPRPGVALLSKHSRGELLRRLGRPLYRRRADARRMLAVLEDMVSARITVSRSVWTSAIHITGRASGDVSKQDLARAVGVWRQMEHTARIRADGVTFNVLFDLAVRSGQHAVAERLLEESKKRGTVLPRFGKVSNIYYQGALGDADAVRKAFDEFIESGEIVDTVALNCVLRSFIRAGDIQAAEQLYERMLKTQSTVHKSYDDKKQWMYHFPTLSPDHKVYRLKTKRLGRFLQYSSKLKDLKPDHYNALQEKFPLMPDQRTFHILLSCHAEKTGNLDRFMSVLKDFETHVSAPSHGIVYLLLFEGFARFGMNNKQWSAEKLHTAWQACLRTIYYSIKSILESSGQPRLKWQHPFASDANQKKGDKPVSHEKVISMLLRSRVARQLRFMSSIERRVGNGLFLGPRLITVVIRAFGSCCSEQELVDVWLEIERTWQPYRRISQDVQAVREELEKQLAKKRR